MTLSPRPWIACAMTLLAACTEPASLTIDLVTDVVPGDEFVRVVTVISREAPGALRDQLRRDEVASFDVADTELSFEDGVTVGALPGLPTGEYWITVSLVASDGRVLIAQPTRQLVAGATGVTVRITRDCLGVECPGSGPPANLACLAGQCVDPRCAPETPEFCPPLSCDADTDCVPPAAACADVRCVHNTCFSFSETGSCPVGAWCNPELGCVSDDLPSGGCSSEPCATGNICTLGRRACDGSETCVEVARTLSGSPCDRGECDGLGDCAGLTLRVESDGDGSIVSDPAGILCDGSATEVCERRFDRGADVSLLASDGVGTSFAGWEGDCASTEGARCFVEVDDAVTVRALYTARIHDVSVSTRGTGRVEGLGDLAAVIDCGASCDAAVSHGTVVELRAVPESGASFGAWGGACSGTVGETCTLTVEGPVEVGATFISAGDRALSITRVGSGAGDVTSAPAGIDCGLSCAAGFSDGTVVTLTARAAPTSSFVGWAGDGAACGSAPTCMVTLDAARSVEARFDLELRRLTVESPTGAGNSVRANAVGIDCPTSQCTADVPLTTSVTLSAIPGAQFEFDRWELPASCGTSPSCAVTVTSDVTVRARFRRRPVTLTVMRSGAGTGLVREPGAGRIDCGADCTEQLTPPASITLEATPSAGSNFTAWDVPSCGSNPTCEVSLDADVVVTARFTLAQHTLTVERLGDGDGLIRSGDGRIDCGADCSETGYLHGSSVTLTAFVNTGTFAGWGGAGASCGATPTCEVTMTAARHVTARFTLAQHTLSVGSTGNGSGAIRSSAPDSRIDCDGSVGETCSADYTEGTMVTLVATPASDSLFTGWVGGGCSGVGTCVVTVSGATSVQATFALQTRSLDVSVSGSGSVRSSPGSIDCPGTCSEEFDHGTVVTLSATPQAGHRFRQWGGDAAACGTTTTCQITMDGPQTAVATFDPIVHDLFVEIAGTGSGGVQGDGIDCNQPAGGSDRCQTQGAPGSTVTLRATPLLDSTFTGWSGAPGCGASPTCEVTLEDPTTTVQATFEPSGGECVLTIEMNPSEGEYAVQISPGGLSCVADGTGSCRVQVECGAYTLDAFPKPPIFQRFSGCIEEPPGTCRVNVVDTTVVTATWSGGGV